jgi:restriction system protein
MTFLDAAYEVLREAGQPLHYIEITERAIVADLIDTQGQTPEATMGSRLYVAIKRPGTRFRKVGKGTFGLAEARSTNIAQRIEDLNRRTREELRGRLHTMPADRFEALIGELLIALGFDESTVEVTSYRGDGGIDVRGVLHAGGITEFSAAVQVKRWKTNVRAPIVRELRGSLTVHEQGIVITTSGFSKGARQEAEETGKARISLIDGEQLLELLIEHGIGVTQEPYTVLALDEEWWGEVAGSTPSEPPPPPPTPAVPPTVIYPLVVRIVVRGQTFEAEMLDQRGRMRFQGVEYRSPSGAGQTATGWKSCNGWSFWKYQHPETGEWRLIKELRAEQ